MVHPGLCRYVPEFLDNEVDGRCLKDLSMEELQKELQVTQLGPRKARVFFRGDRDWKRCDSLLLL